MQEKTFEQNGVCVVFRNTLRQTLRYRALLAALDIDDNETDGDVQDRYALVAGFAVEVTGLNGWSPPEGTANAKTLKQSYQQFLDVASYGLLDDMKDAVLDLLAPTANDIEKLDSALTVEEAADPNS